MTHRLPICTSRKILPLFVASALWVTGCSGEQAGDANGGMAGGLGGGVSGTTVLGVAGAVALAGLLLDSDSDNNTAVGDTNTTNNNNANNNDNNNTNNSNSSNNNDNNTTNDNNDNNDNNSTNNNDNNTSDNNDNNSSNNNDNSTTTDNTPVLENSGAANTDLLEEQAVLDSGTVGTGSAADVTAMLNFDRTTGDVDGSVKVGNMVAQRVDLMLGPPGAVGFVNVALEGNPGDSVWTIPDNLTAGQQAFVLQNLNSGNLYIAARSGSPLNEEVRRQLLPAGVEFYTTGNVSDVNGESGQGYVLVNTLTGDYSITLNTSYDELAEAHVNDGIVSGATENNYVPLTRRNSAKGNFFLDGNYTNPADPLYPDLLDRLRANQVFFDAHTLSNDMRVLLSPVNLTATP